MKPFLLVFIGGGLGSALRYAISKWIPYVGQGIPWHTLTVNILGSFIIGLILGHYLQINSTNNTLALLLVTGFCGGFTTFSSFAFENVHFFKSGDITSLLLYSLCSLIICFMMVGVGLWLSKLF